MSALLDVRELSKDFAAGGADARAGLIRAVDRVSLAVNRGETLGLVGESGCGKSTLGRLILRLLEPTAGQILFEGKNITHLSHSSLLPYRKKMQLVFQDPFASLNPQATVERTLSEPLRVHRIVTGNAALRQEVRCLLDKVGLSTEVLSRFPHELSGGQLQRVAIARALTLNPQLLVCDEPVSALDVSLQAQVINVLKDVQQQNGLTYIFIAHDLRMVRHISDSVAVMYMGAIVETATKDKLFTEPRHPYTQALLAAVPVPDPSARKQRILLSGDAPGPWERPPGCRFHPRCPHALQLCKEEEPLMQVAGPGHNAACHRLNKV